MTAAFAAAYAAAALAGAGEIHGVVTAGEPGGDVVVWVDGSKTADPPVAKLVLTQKDMAFSPHLLVAVAGQTVLMPNEDDLAHNVFSGSEAQRFNLGIYAKGETKSVVFAQPGIVDVQCSIHKRMNAKVVVVPDAHFTRAEAGAPYRIRDVPAGQHTIKVWREGFSQQSRQVTVPDRGEVVLNLTLEPLAK
jgi:plastocyanin